MSMSLGDYNVEGYKIKVAEEAFMQICLAGLEAYSVPHEVSKRKSEDGLETYGSLWRREGMLSDGRGFYSIEFASVDTSADKQADCCRHRLGALELRKGIV